MKVASEAGERLGLLGNNASTVSRGYAPQPPAADVLLHVLHSTCGVDYIYKAVSTSVVANAIAARQSMLSVGKETQPVMAKALNNNFGSTCNTLLALLSADRLIRILIFSGIIATQAAIDCRDPAVVGQAGGARATVCKLDISRSTNLQSCTV